MHWRLSLTVARCGRTGCQTEAKHYAGYGQSGMDGLYTDISNGTLFDVYLRPWRAFAQKAGGRGVMASHQTLNGVPNHANHWLLTEVWRGKFGANHSFTASDQDDVTRLYINSRGQGYGVAQDCLHAGALALNAGLDSALGYTCFQNLTQALNQGLIDDAALDRAAGNVLRAKFAAGLFDGHAYSDPTGSQKIRTIAAQRLAYQTAVESVTLVQNLNGTLPLKVGAVRSGAVRRIAVVGPNAGCAVESATSCSSVQAQMGPYVWDSGENTVSVLQAVRRSISEGQLEEVTYHQGAYWTSYNDSLLEAAVEGAKAADVVIAVVGDSEASYGHGTCAEGIDADTLDLPGGQLALLDAVVSTGVPVVAVLINGRPATFGAGPFALTGPNNALLKRLAAVLVAWRPGEAGGTAIWDLMLGKENPSGHLTQNWLRNVGAVRGPSNPWFQPRRPGLPFQYVTEQTTPLFSFG
jgi:beta-glucosidase